MGSRPELPALPSAAFELLTNSFQQEQMRNLFARFCQWISQDSQFDPSAVPGIVQQHRQAAAQQQAYVSMLPTAPLPVIPPMPGYASAAVPASMPASGSASATSTQPLQTAVNQESCGKCGRPILFSTTCAFCTGSSTSNGVAARNGAVPAVQSPPSPTPKRQVIISPTLAPVEDVPVHLRNKGLPANIGSVCRVLGERCSRLASPNTLRSACALPFQELININQHISALPADDPGLAASEIGNQVQATSSPQQCFTPTSRNMGTPPPQADLVQSIPDFAKFVPCPHYSVEQDAQASLAQDPFGAEVFHVSGVPLTEMQLGCILLCAPEVIQKSVKYVGYQDIPMTTIAQMINAYTDHFRRAGAQEYPQPNSKHI